MDIRFQPPFNASAYNKAKAKAKAKTTTSKVGAYPPAILAISTPYSGHVRVDDEFPPIEQLLESPLDVMDFTGERETKSESLRSVRPTHPPITSIQEFVHNGDTRSGGTTALCRSWSPTEGTGSTNNVEMMKSKDETKPLGVNPASDHKSGSAEYLSNATPISFGEAAPDARSISLADNRPVAPKEPLGAGIPLHASSHFVQAAGDRDLPVSGSCGRSKLPMDQGESSSSGDDDIPPGQWEVDNIIGQEVVNGVTYYMVAWKPTLEPEGNLGYLTELIQQWKGRVEAQRKRKDHRNDAEIKKQGVASKSQIGLGKMGSRVTKRGRGRPRKI